MSAAPLVFDRVSLVRGGARVLDDVSFTLTPGEQLAIVGQSGVGKSLLLRLILGLVAPTGGDIRLFGEELGGRDPDALRALRGRCGVALQGGSLIGALSVVDNLGLALGGGQARAERAGRRLERMMLDFNLGYLAGRSVRDISSGEQQRVELARAFLRDPELVLLDEPLERAHADAAALEAAIRRQTVMRHRSTLLITQDAALAERLASRVLTLRRGRLG